MLGQLVLTATLTSDKRIHRVCFRYNYSRGRHGDKSWIWLPNRIVRTSTHIGRGKRAIRAWVNGLLIHELMASSLQCVQPRGFH
ncbi:hypothetical protein GQ600_13121 [Phytophthora cactorum]|nr:hypothetical protein GQ600_13121 [Phytophthora cactorum]